jgi:sortase A
VHIVAELDQIDADAPGQHTPGEAREPAPANEPADADVEAASDPDDVHTTHDVDTTIDTDIDTDDVHTTHDVDTTIDTDIDTVDVHTTEDVDTMIDANLYIDTTIDTAEDADVDEGTLTNHSNRWDRPPPPKDWRWWVGGTGKVLIAAGLLLLGFVAYQLWGTGLETARAQRALESDFEELLAIAPEIEPADIDPAVTDATTTETPADAVDTGDEADPTDADPSGTDQSAGGGLAPEPETVTELVVLEDGSFPLPVESQVIPEVEGGDALARIEIPAIGVDNIVVAGVQTSDLKKGPGHFPETPLPGQLGNAAIAGHRTTYGQPFHNVDKLEWGDEIIVTTLTGRYVYLVNGREIVSPSDYQVVTTVDPTVANLTLTSCHPKWTARERIIITSILDQGRSDRIGEPVLNYGRPVESEATSDDPGDVADAADDDPAITEASGGVSGNLLDTSTVDEQLVGVAALNSGAADAGIADSFAEGWFSDPEAWWDVAMWASILVLICLLGYAIARRFRRSWVGITIGVLPFVVALFFFYQNVNRLLPPNL